MIHLIFYTCLILLTTNLSSAQPSQPKYLLSEKDCLKLALKNHPAIIQAERSLLTAQYRYQSQQLQWKVTMKPLTQETTLAEEKLTFNATTGLEWQSPSGGSINIQSSIYYDYDNVVSNLFDFDDYKSYLNSTVLSAKYPLLGADKQANAITVKSNDIAYQNAIQQYRATIQDTLVSVSQNYRQIMMLEDQLEITKKLNKQASEQHKALLKEVKAGKKAKKLVPESELQLLQFELDIMHAENSLRKANLALHINLKIDKNEIIKITRKTVDNLEEPNPVNDILFESLKQNPSLINMKNQIVLQAQTNKQELSKQSLQANSFAQFSFGSIPRSQGRLQLTYPLDQRTIHLQNLSNETTLALQKSQFIEKCEDTVEDLENTYRELLLERKSLQLQKKKHLLEEESFNHLLAQNKMGLVAAMTLNDKLNTLNSNTINIANKLISYRTKLDNYHIQCSTYLPQKQDLLPTSMLLNLAKKKSPFDNAKSQKKDIRSMCQALLNA